MAAGGDRGRRRADPPPQVGAQGLSSDATLGSLTVSVGDIGFDPDEDRYVIGVAADVTQATVTATANHSDAKVRFLGPADADPSAPGHQRELAVGANDISIVVTAPDKTTEQRYRVFINRGSIGWGGWKAVDDLDGLRAADNHDPAGISSNGTTMWVADWSDLKLYAYRLTSGTRDANKDIALHADNRRPSGIWTDNTTMWVADTEDDKLYAYRLADGARDDAQDFDLHADNADPFGIWSNGTTMWVSDWVDDTVYAYDVASGARDSNRGIRVARSAHILGIWSNGTTMWVADDTDRKLYAYRLDNGSRSPEFDVDLAFRNWSPYGIWSDGTTMWVAEDQLDKVYAYNLPLWADLHPENTGPWGVWSDGDTIWVNDLADNKVYAYQLADGTRIESREFNLHSSNSNAQGMWSNGTTIWVADLTGNGKVYAYQLASGTRDADKDIDPTTDPAGLWSDGTTLWVSESVASEVRAYRLDDGTKQAEFGINTNQAGGVWSDGTTLWVVDADPDTLRDEDFLSVLAYSLPDGARVPSREFDLHPDNTDPKGMWSDGTTMWIVDSVDDVLYTYDISGLVTAQVGGL